MSSSVKVAGHSNIEAMGENCMCVCTYTCAWTHVHVCVTSACGCVCTYVALCMTRSEEDIGWCLHIPLLALIPPRRPFSLYLEYTLFSARLVASKPQCSSHPNLSQRWGYWHLWDHTCLVLWGWHRNSALRVVQKVPLTTCTIISSPMRKFKKRMSCPNYNLVWVFKVQF